MGIRGKKIDDELREKIKAYYATTGNMNETAKKFNVSWGTVQNVVKEDPDKFEELREQKKAEMINRIWDDMESALELGRQKIHLAKVAQGAFWPKVDELTNLLRKEGAQPKEIIDVVKSIASVMNIPLSHISTYFGTLYDKQALMNGDNTQNVGLNGGIELVTRTPDVVDEKDWNK